MVAISQINNDTTSQKGSTQQDNHDFNRGQMNEKPQFYSVRAKEHDKLRKDDFLTKAKINIDTAINTPGYAYRGLKGDPDFNFFEYLKVSKIPYYLGGLGLAAVALCGKNNLIPSAKKANNQFVKKILTGVIMYYAAREVANAVIDIPVKLFRGIDLNMPYRKVTSLREGNPMNLPSNKKPSNQRVFESTEFTRWDLLYKYGKNANTNATFDELAKKFGATQPLKDADSTLISKIRKLMVMTTSWKYMLSVPFVTMALGMAQQSAFENTDFRSLLKDTANLFKPSTKRRFSSLGISFKENILKPIAKSFVELWKGKSIASKIIGRGAIISAAALSILANIMILNKTSIKNDKQPKIHGGQK